MTLKKRKMEFFFELLMEYLDHDEKDFIGRFDGSKRFLGNGILYSLDNSDPGVVIQMVEKVSDAPSITLNAMTFKFGRVQHFPPLICSRILDPQSDDIILDMCGFTGLKTSHISALMHDRGIVIALEKQEMMIEKLRKRCDYFQCKNVRIFPCYSINCVKSDSGGRRENVKKGPPFSRGCFDRILLDASSSHLGRRPLIFYELNKRQMMSFVSSQKKLFSNAVELLKVGGVLVYSTCTVTISENEGIVAWALKTFPRLELMSAREKYESFELREFTVSSGYTVNGLTPHDAEKVLRFGPETDSVGFFIASFRKR